MSWKEEQSIHKQVRALLTDELCQGTLSPGARVGMAQIDVLEVDFPGEAGQRTYLLIRDASAEEIALDVYHTLSLYEPTEGGEERCVQKYPVAVCGSLEEARQELSRLEQAYPPLPDLPTVTTLEGIHVTDDPSNVLRVLHAGIPLDQGRKPGKVGDLQTSGLYFSEVTHPWVRSRSATLWQFAETLTREERERIGRVIVTDKSMNGEEWYLTASEVRPVSSKSA